MCPRLFFFLCGSDLGKLIRSYSAQRTLKVLRQILKLSAGSYAALGTAFLLIIFPATNVAYIFHTKFLFSVNYNTSEGAE